MNGGTIITSQTASESPQTRSKTGFLPTDYNVRVGIDVSAHNPADAVLAAICDMKLANPESFNFAVENLHTGKQWYAELDQKGNLIIEAE